MRIADPRHRLIIALTLCLALLAAGGSSAAVSGSDRAGGALSLNAALLLRSTSTPGCPLRPSSDQCVTRTTSGVVRGLGPVAATYSHYLGLGLPTCPAGSGKALASSIRLAVASKGEIELAVAEATTCLVIAGEAVPNQAQTFTITGGTGIFAGASGSGTLQRNLGQDTCDASSCHRDGFETWTGILTVPGLEFDVTAPTFSGAASRTVRAKRGAKSARVTYRVTAHDDRNGTVPAVCRPRSGSRFRIGKTRVTCQATDGSANTGNATFTVTVKRRAA